MPPDPKRAPEGGEGSIAVPPGSGSEGAGGTSAASARPVPTPASMAELIRGPLPGPVKIIFLDMDGTLSDGMIGYTATTDFRNYWVRDGIALQWARDLGVLSVVISGRASRAAAARMEDLKLEYHEGVRDKVAVAERILKREGATWEQCVMVGDDLPDVALMKRVGWPIAVANAQPEVQKVARTLLGTQGGHGAVREMVEMVLRHNGTWEQVLQWYEAG